MSRWPAFSIHLGMSILEPLADERTARTSPTWDSRIPRMSSIRGPGQKLPRASMVRVMVGAVSSIRVSLPGSPGTQRPVVGVWWSDEQRRGAVVEELDDGGGTDRLAEPVDHVLALEAEHVHRHLAGHELDAERLGRLEQLLRLGDAVLLREDAHHPGAHPEKVHLRQLAVADARSLHRGHHLLHPGLTS